MSELLHFIIPITANFNVEPILEDFLTKYPPEGDEFWQIVFQGQGEHNQEDYIYLIVARLPLNGYKSRGHGSFQSFLQTYVEYQNKIERKKLTFAIKQHGFQRYNPPQ